MTNSDTRPDSVGQAHTAGGWHVGGKDGTIIFDDATGYAVADAKTFHGKHGGIDVCRANAQLAASAPALLAVDREMLPTNLNLTHPSWNDDTVVPIDITMGELRRIAAAIAKAKGGQS